MFRNPKRISPALSLPQLLFSRQNILLILLQIKMKSIKLISNPLQASLNMIKASFWLFSRRLRYFLYFGNIWSFLFCFFWLINFNLYKLIFSLKMVCIMIKIILRLRYTRLSIYFSQFFCFFCIFFLFIFLIISYYFWCSLQLRLMWILGRFLACLSK